MQLKLTTLADAFNPVPGDLHLDNGQLVLIGDPNGNADDFKQAILQDCTSALQMFKGEWFLDLNEGVPYFEAIFVKNPTLETIKSIFRQVLLSRNHVKNIVSIDITIDKQTRTARVDFVATLTTGDTLDTTILHPIIVEFP